MKKLFIGLLLCLSMNAFGMRKAASLRLGMHARFMSSGVDSLEFKRWKTLDEAEGHIHGYRFDLANGVCKFGSAVWLLNDLGLLSKARHKALLKIEGDLVKAHLAAQDEFDFLRDLAQEDQGKKKTIRANLLATRKDFGEFLARQAAQKKD